MSELYDVIILGGGPAGLSAGLYAGRSRMKTLVIEKGAPGGQIALSAEMENYPGQMLEGESGATLSARMAEQCARFGTEHRMDDIRAVELSGEIKRLVGEEGEYQARTVIIATGASPRPIGCENEKEFTGRGVSYCGRRRRQRRGGGAFPHPLCQNRDHYPSAGCAARGKVHSGEGVCRT